ncbi:MAG: hypothetical protein COU42_03115 [Candidatus Nealsonbacteria bacterium CG10_big_fil_rev_8_21_14_0_10_36_24]|uniref:PilN domain-containing protein n=2 Tax=Candidatus Nealsoniibacteriota TaxID=1817911 RepID=A0A2H0YR22_9BACT|nr:MAG: hypothetical protein COU42_03115 [Candidatus Nealsonbacteria bacterium CG10_big_fil_rev_8_21_14_0_10_36_24]PIS40192.1 MAG: hypothetical protein COT32_01080 [Candidatus Nealsonbacteria bacterium CG08_land_8_20_14_0_20_36_22]
MINLLPPEEKEKLFLEKKKRMVSILWFLVLFFIVCLILILLSMRIYLREQVKAQEALLSGIKQEGGRTEIEEYQERVHFINSEITKLNSFYQKKIYFSEIIEKISRTLPQENYLTNLSIIFSPEKEIKVSLSGFSPTRELLFEFLKNLEQEQDFKEVSFPPANWVKAKDIDFFVTFGISRGL